MPPVVALFSAPIIGGITLGGIVGGALASTALSYIANGLLGQEPEQPAFGEESRDRQLMLRASAAPHRLIYGSRMLVSGVLVYAQNSGANNEYIHLVMVVAGHELAVTPHHYFLGDEIVLAHQIDGSGNVIAGKFANHVRF